MKNKIFNNLLLKCAAIVSAIILWLIIVNVDNPTTTKTIYNIPVNLKNTETLTEAGTAYDVISGEAIAVQVKGPRNVVDSLKAADFVASADIDTREITDTVPIEVYCIKTGVTCIKNAPTVLKLSLEDIDEKTFDIKVSIIGTPAEGYAVGNSGTSRNKIRVKGPVSQLNLISKVVAQIDVSAAVTDLNENAPLKLFDGNGEEINIETSKLEMSISDVIVSTQILKTKNIPVKLTVSGETEAEYRYTGMDYSPKNITVAGYDEDLKQITSLTIPSDVISIKGLTETTKKQVTISSYLPNGIKLVSDATTVDVTLNIEPILAQEVAINKEDIVVNGKSDLLEYSYADNNPLAILVKGITRELSEITDGSIKATINVSGLVAGSHTVKVTFETTGSYKISDEYFVAVNVTEKPTDPQTDESKDGKADESESETQNVETVTR